MENKSEDKLNEDKEGIESVEKEVKTTNNNEEKTTEAISESEDFKEKSSLEEELPPKEDEAKFKLTKEQEETLEKMSDSEALKEIDNIMGENDKVIAKDYIGSHIEQNDGTEVIISVEDIYYNPEKRAFKNRFAMKSSPPNLVLTDSNGNEVRIALTENLTDELSYTLKQVKRAYYGFSGPNDIKIPDKPVDKFKYLLNKYKFKIAGIVFIGILLFLLNIV